MLIHHIGAHQNTPSICLEVECMYPSMEMRSRSLLTNFFYSSFNTSYWRYVSKILSILKFIASLLITFDKMVLSQPFKNVWYFFQFFNLLLHFFFILLRFQKFFLYLFPKDTISNIYSEFIYICFSLYCLDFTDGSITHNSASF